MTASSISRPSLEPRLSASDKARVKSIMQKGYTAREAIDTVQWQNGRKAGIPSRRYWSIGELDVLLNPAV